MDCEASHKGYLVLHAHQVWQQSGHEVIHNKTWILPFKREKVEPIQRIIQKIFCWAIIDKDSVFNIGPCICLNTMSRSLSQNGTKGFLGTMYAKALQCFCDNINGIFLCFRRSTRQCACRDCTKKFFPPVASMSKEWLWNCEAMRARISSPLLWRLLMGCCTSSHHSLCLDTFLVVPHWSPTQCNNSWFWESYGNLHSNESAHTTLQKLHKLHIS